MDFVSFGCLGQHCCDLVNQHSEHSEHTSLFKAALQAKVSINNPGKQLEDFIAMLIRFAHEQDDVEVTRMLTFYLTETILFLRVKPLVNYTNLFEELFENNNLIRDSLLGTESLIRPPALSEGYGRHNNKKKDPRMKENDEQFPANSIKYILKHFIIKSHPNHQQAALTVVDRVVCRARNDTTFEDAGTTFYNWWKSSYYYDNIMSEVPAAADASTYSLTVALNDFRLSGVPHELDNEFGRIDNGLIFTWHAIVCCFENTQWDVMERLFQGQGVDAYFKGRRRPKTNAEKALAGVRYKISDFEILDYLGGGSFGRVVLARLKSNPAQQLALKLVSVKPCELLQLSKEIVLASHVRSDHTAKVLGYFAVPELVLKSEEGTYTMAIMMEYCGSATLRTHITSQQSKQTQPPLRAIWACGIIEQVLRGVQAIHAQDFSEFVVHAYIALL